LQFWRPGFQNQFLETIDCTHQDFKASSGTPMFPYGRPGMLSRQALEGFFHRQLVNALQDAPQLDPDVYESRPSGEQDAENDGEKDKVSDVELVGIEARNVLRRCKNNNRQNNYYGNT